MHYLSFILLSVITLILSESHKEDLKKRQKVVSIQTKYGEIQVKLYNETPQHRDNFIKLTKGGYYDSLLFHRVIDAFMIQGGDPESRNAKPKQKLGDGGPDYTIPAEFVEGIYHKRGVIAAAREGDNINPEKASSGSQFYLVQGRVFTNEELDQLEIKMRERTFAKCLGEYIQEPENDSIQFAYKQATKNRNKAQIDSLNGIVSSIYEEELAAVKLNEEQREIYTTVGGTPHLDGAYTVFGEIVSGMNVVDSIAAVQTDKNNRPLEDVVFSITMVK